MLFGRLWLFSRTPNGSRTSAFFYSLIETAKANGLEPYHYMRELFEKLPDAQTEVDLSALLPYRSATTAYF